MTPSLLRSVAPRLLLGVLLASHARGARPDDEPRAEPRHFGVGWHIGNGLGLQSADLILAGPRVALELQLGFEDGAASGRVWSGYALAPAVRGYLHADGSSPFGLVGMALARKTWGSLWWIRPGAFANVGYAWRATSGIEFLLGAGIAWAPEWNASDASGSVRDPEYFGLNLEIGLRFMFL